MTLPNEVTSANAGWRVLFAFVRRIPRFVRLHGGRTAGSTTPLLLYRAWVRGYRDAHAIRRRLGYTPWFLRTFEVLESLALLFLIGSAASALWVD
jgi:hypothetical protein